MLSYSAVLPYPKVTLPSVEMWGTNMNIIKDPPKGIFTRRKDKVSQTQQILLQQDDAGSRINEYINVYARNVNPMVGVSHNNYGNSQSGGRRGQASLPYKVDVVRPPILSPYDLQPLSRLPRTWFYASTNPEFPTIVQNSQCNELGKSIENFNIRSNIKVDSARTMLNNVKSSEGFSVQDVSKIKQKTPLSSSIVVNKTSLGRTNMEHDVKNVKTKNVLTKDVSTSKKLNVHVNVNNNPVRKLNESKKPKKTVSFAPNLVRTQVAPPQQSSHLSFTLATKPKIGDVSTPKTFSKPQSHTPIYNLSSRTPHYEMFSNQSSFNQSIQHTNLPELDRKLPMTQDISTRKVMNSGGMDAGLPSRDKKLIPRLSNYGGFDNGGSAIPNPNNTERQPLNSKMIDNNKPKLKEHMQAYFRV